MAVAAYEIEETAAEADEVEVATPSDAKSVKVPARKASARCGFCITGHHGQHLSGGTNWTCSCVCPPENEWARPRVPVGSDDLFDLEPGAEADE